MKRNKRKQRLHNFFIAISGITVFLLMFLGVLIYANWAAVKNEIAYATSKKTTPTPIVSATPTPTATPTPIVEPAHIVIEKVGVDAPITWEVPAVDTLPALDHGVAHLAGSARLGQIGNLFITGHSSDYSWKKNPYAAVFSLLPKLTTGDTITIRENGQAFTYRITQTKIVKPTQVEVANATTTPMLTLMTCYPVGSTKDRFIVQAQLISSPVQSANTTQHSATVLPQINFR